jgi:hypothetical protein
LRRVVPELLHRPPPWGPIVMTEEAARFKDITVFPCRYFYPFSWWEPHPSVEALTNAYAIHHWAANWQPSRLRHRLGVWKRVVTNWLFGNRRHLT